MKNNIAIQYKLPILSAATIISMFAALLTTPQPVQAANPQPIQVFFLSMPEDQVFASFKKISSAAPAAPMHSVTGISVTTTNTQIYYDQWENGYESDLANPVNVYSSLNLGGTQIWGNHLAADGCPPNVDGRTALVCSDANDVLTLGNVIVLENDVPLPRTSAVFYDGRDKLGGTTVLAVTRSVWATSPGTVLADAVEVYDTTRWGTSYELPIGENTTNNPQNATATTMFNYSSVLIIASENGTSVTIDKDGPGATAATTVVLNQGDAYQVDGGMKMGGTITSTKPVQANLLTGKLASSYASRWYSLPPQSYWTDSLWTSVGTTVANYPATVFIYNPSDSTPMTVNYETKLGTGSFSVPVNGTYRFEMPLLSGAHFYTSGIPFQAVGGMDASLTGADQTYDWGFSLVPDTWLTTAFIAGWAPGNATYTGNGSPIWVTAIKGTTIYVDYGAPSPVGTNLDPKGRPYDVSYVIGQYESKQINGVGNTQTGIKVWTADGTSITGAWGEDPKTAAAGTPYLDVGYTIPPLPEIMVNKTAALAIDLNANTKLDPGDTIEYTLTIRNNGAVTAFNVAITDSIPAHTTYVAGSTKLNGTTVPDNPSFPLISPGILIPSMNVGASATIKYQMTTAAVPPSAPYSEILNVANANINGDNFSFTLHTPVNSSATTCTAAFMNVSYASTVATYQQNGTTYIQVTDLDKNTNASVAETVSVQVVNPSTSDRQALTLTESGAATGIFRASLPTSSTTGLSPDDGTLYVLSGNTIQVNYTDPLYSDTCSASATFSAPTFTKELYLSDTLLLDRVDPVATSDSTTVESAPFDGSGGGSATIAISGTATSGAANQASSLTFSHNTGSGTNQLLLVGVSIECAGANCTATTIDPTVQTVTFNGTNLTRIGRVSANNIDAQVEIWGLFAPSTNTNANVVVNLGGTTTTQDWAAGAITLSGVKNETLTGVFNTGNSTTPTVNVTSSSATGQWVFDVVSFDNLQTSVGTVAGTNQTRQWFQSIGTGTGNAVIASTGSTKSATGTTSSWTGSATSNWAIGAVVLNPAGGSATTTTATFTLGSALASTLSIPASAAVSAPLYLNVTSGSMSATPAITGVLKYGTSYATATTLATLSTANFSGGLLTLSGVTGGAVTNIPAGNFIYLDVTSTLTGITYTIRYDSSTYPSKINLPTTTVIKVDSLDIYDAPSPAGALISNPSSGQTVYIRGSISDPFGYADITSAVLDITDPASATTSITSAPANIVSSSGASTVFEFPWVIPSTTGTYAIKLTGKEGYENSVTDSRSTLIAIAFQDTGTPSSIEFTSGLDGTSTTSYDPTASPTNQVCIRVTDFDQNLNPAVAETITVTLNSSKVDPQTVTLTETGVNTGIFVNCVTREITSGAGGTEPDGQIYALAGDLLTVSYTDPTDPADTTSANAILTSGTATLTLAKQTTQPADGLAVLGEIVKFDITIANPNANTLTTVNLTDTYPGSCLTFVSASLAPDSAAANPLVWSNIGPIASHASKTVSLTFTANAVCTAVAATNQADSYAIDSLSNRIPATGTVSATASVAINDPQVTVSKTLKAGSPNPAQIGQDVTFVIAVTNTGSTTINTLPVIDNYSAYCMEFNNATNGGTGSGGTVAWANLGPLAASATISSEVTFTVQGPCNPAQNTATIDGAYDSNGDPVPSVQSSVTFVTQSQGPAVTKSFSAAGVALNGTATLTFNFTNPNLYAALTGVAFTDTYPTGLVNDTPLVTSNTCTGGTLTASAGGNSIAYAGGSIPANSSCAITVTVKATAYGSLSNNVTVTSTNSLLDGTANDTLDVIDIVATDDTGANVDNSTGGQALANVLVNDTLNGTSPVVLSTVNLTQESLLDSSNNPATGIALNLVDGSVNVTAGTAPGAYTLTYKICDKTYTAICDTAAVTIKVFAPPTVAKSFAPAAIEMGGTTVLSLTLTNPSANPGNLTSVLVDDTFPTGVSLKDVTFTFTPASCGTVTRTDGVTASQASDTAVRFNAGTLTPGSNCKAQINVTSSTSGIVTNTTQAPTASAGSLSLTGTTANADIGVLAKPTIAKTFNPTSIQGGETSTITFTLTNPNATDLTGASFTDQLINMQISGVQSASGTCTGATTNNFNSGDTNLSFSGITIPASGNCTVTVLITSNAMGTNDNFASGITTAQTTVGSPSSTVSLTVSSGAAIQVVQAVSATVVSSGGSVTYTYTVTNTGGSSLTTINVTDNKCAPVTYQSGDTNTNNILETTETWVYSCTTTLSATTTNIVTASGKDSLNTTVQDTDTATVTVIASGITKTIQSTNETFTTGNHVAIGEIVTYEITINLPSGIAFPNTVVTDKMDKGLAFVDCTLVQVAGSDVTGTVCPPTVSAITDTGDSPTNPANAGRQVQFTIGDIAAPASDSTLVIRYTAIALDVIENQDKVNLNNNATWTWTGGTLSASALNVTIVEPDLSITKSASPTFVLTGQSTTFSLFISHTAQSSADAFDVVVTDLIPTGLTYVPCSLTYAGLAPDANKRPADPCNLGTNNLSFGWDTFPLGQTATISFQATLTSTQATNTGFVAWTSLPLDPSSGGAPVQLSTYNTKSTEREYDPGDPANTYQVSSSVEVGITDTLPDSGFAPNKLTILPNQPASKLYAPTDIWLEIPSLGVKTSIVGVPYVNGQWDVSWLWNQAGWLNGTAFPSWQGNSVITGHVYLPNGAPGLFVNLGKLKWNDVIVIHAYGSRFIYAVQENNTIAPNDTSILEHEDKAWITLVTCKNYDEKLKIYKNRIAVRARLVAIKADK